MSSFEKGTRYISDVLSYSREHLEKEDYSNLRIKDIIGFEPPKGSNVFLPNVNCVPTTSLLALYDTLVVGFPKIDKIDHFRDKIGLTFDDVIALAHKGRLVPFIDVDCIGCLREMSEVVQQLVDNNVDLFLGGPQSTLLALRTAESAGVDYKSGKKLHEELSLATENEEQRKEREEVLKKTNVHVYWGTPYVRLCASIKPTSEFVVQLIRLAKEGSPKEYIDTLADRLTMVPNLLLAKAFNSTFSTNAACRYIEETEKLETPLGTNPLEAFDPYVLEFIERKLRIAYSENLPISEYIDIFDSRTTEAMRTIFGRIVTSASSKGGSLINLQNSIEEYNRQVEELIARSTKRTKMVYATSDVLRANAGAIKMLLEGAAEKYINAPEKAWDCFIVPKRYRNAVSKWLGEKAVGLEAALAGVTPEAVHLYHTRTCIDRLAAVSSSN
jgi:hypothetical protein